MGEPGRDPDLPEKALRLVGMSTARKEDLDGHLAAVLEILGQIDRRHPPATDFFLDPVPVRHGGPQAFRNGSQASGSRIVLWMEGKPAAGDSQVEKRPQPTPGRSGA